MPGNSACISSADIRKAAGRYVKRHRALLHEILHSFDIQPKDYEDIAPLREWHGFMKLMQVMGTDSNGYRCGYGFPYP